MLDDEDEFFACSHPQALHEMGQVCLVHTTERSAHAIFRLQNTDNSDSPSFASDSCILASKVSLFPVATHSNRESNMQDVLRHQTNMTDMQREDIDSWSHEENLV